MIEVRQILDKYMIRAHEIVTAHGFNEEFDKIRDRLLVVSEISECLEASRIDKHGDYDTLEHEMQLLYDQNKEDDALFVKRFKELVSNSVEDELSDIVIRCMNLLVKYKYDVTDATAAIVKPTPMSLIALLDSCINHLYASDTYWTPLLEVITSVINYCNLNNLDIDNFINKKLYYNTYREYMHGNKRY